MAGGRAAAAPVLPQPGADAAEPGDDEGLPDELRPLHDRDGRQRRPLLQQPGHGGDGPRPGLRRDGPPPRDQLPATSSPRRARRGPSPATSSTPAKPFRVTLAWTDAPGLHVRQRLQEQPRPDGDRRREHLPRQRLHRRELGDRRHRGHAEQRRERLPARGRDGALHGHDRRDEHQLGRRSRERLGARPGLRPRRLQRLHVAARRPHRRLGHGDGAERGDRLLHDEREPRVSRLPRPGGGRALYPRGEHRGLAFRRQSGLRGDRLLLRRPRRGLRRVGELERGPRHLDRELHPAARLRGPGERHERRRLHVHEPPRLVGRDAGLRRDDHLRRLPEHDARLRAGARQPHRHGPDRHDLRRRPGSRERDDVPLRRPRRRDEGHRGRGDERRREEREGDGHRHERGRLLRRPRREPPGGRGLVLDRDDPGGDRRDDQPHDRVPLAVEQQGVPVRGGEHELRRHLPRERPGDAQPRRERLDRRGQRVRPPGGRLGNHDLPPLVRVRDPLRRGLARLQHDGPVRPVDQRRGRRRPERAVHQRGGLRQHAPEQLHDPDLDRDEPGSERLAQGRHRQPRRRGREYRLVRVPVLLGLLDHGGGVLRRRREDRRQHLRGLHDPDRSPGRGVLLCHDRPPGRPLGRAPRHGDDHGLRRGRRGGPRLRRRRQSLELGPLGVVPRRGRLHLRRRDRHRHLRDPGRPDPHGDRRRPPVPYGNRDDEGEAGRRDGVLPGHPVPRRRHEGRLRELRGAADRTGRHGGPRVPPRGERVRDPAGGPGRLPERHRREPGRRGQPSRLPRRHGSRRREHSLPLA